MTTNISTTAPASFTERVNDAMLKVIENHPHVGEGYEPTAIKEFKIDEEHNRAAFILFEQIDYHFSDGAEVRYSLWKMEGEGEPVRIKEDNGYRKDRQCSLRNLRLDDEAIRVEHNTTDLRRSNLSVGESIFANALSWAAV